MAIGVDRYICNDPYSRRKEAISTEARGQEARLTGLQDRLTDGNKKEAALELRVQVME